MNNGLEREVSPFFYVKYMHTYAQCCDIIGIIDVLRREDEKMKKEVSLKKSILESTVGYLFLGVLTLLFNTVTIRLLGMEVFGTFTYAYAIITFIMIFTAAGMDNGIMYFFPSKGSKYISFALLVNMVVSLIFISGMMVKSEDVLIRQMLPLVWLLSSQEVFFGVYRCRNRLMTFFNVKAIVGNIVRIMGVTGLYLLGYKGTGNIIFSTTLSGVVCLILHFYNNRELIQRVHVSREFIYFSLPTVIGNIMGQIMNKMDNIMVGNILGKSQVGIYEAAAQLATSTSIVLIIFNTAFAPRIASMYHEGRIEELKNLYCKATRWLLIISLISAGFILVLGKLFLGMYGEEFVRGYNVVVYRSIGQIFNAGVGSVWLMLRMTGKPKLHMYGTLAAVIINLGLNLLLIPSHGIDGAAIASMVSVTFVNLLGFALVVKNFKINPYGLSYKKSKDIQIVN